MIQHPWPILIALFTSLILGAASWIPNSRSVDLLGNIMIASCVLFWAMLDAQVNKKKLGNWQGLGILLLSPIGLLIWFVRTRGWKFYAPYLIYLALVVLVFLMALIGFSVVGFYYGYTFSEIIQLM